MSGDEAGDAPRTGTQDPRRSRRRALKVLFQADLRGQEVATVLAGVRADPAATNLLDDDDTGSPPDATEMDAYAIQLVESVAAAMAELDDVIGRFSEHWTVDRMPVIDRNLLRLATWELLHEDLAPAVVINEAVELAKELAAEKSAGFVNGVLESIRHWHAEDQS